MVLGGVTHVTSSGIAAKVISDLDWIGHRETPVVLSLLVMEDLVMIAYLPILAALLVGTSPLDAGAAQYLQVSAAVGAFLVGVAIADSALARVVSFATPRIVEHI